MSVLLDTQVFLALIEDRFSALPERLRVAIQCHDSHYISVASLWEIAIKQRIGKLDISVPLATLPKLVELLGLSLMPINEHHVLHGLEPQPPTRDPFDRILLAQCAIEGFQLATIDRALVDHPLSATAT